MKLALVDAESRSATGLARRILASRFAAGRVTGGRVMKLNVVFLLLLSHSAWSANSEFFPLEVGNIWVYESSGSACCRPLILEITDIKTLNGNDYFHLHSSAGDDYWLRADEGASVFA